MTAQLTCMERYNAYSDRRHGIVECGRPAKWIAIPIYHPTGHMLLCGIHRGGYSPHGFIPYRVEAIR